MVNIRNRNSFYSCCSNGDSEFLIQFLLNNKFEANKLQPWLGCWCHCLWYSSAFIWRNKHTFCRKNSLRISMNKQLHGRYVINYFYCSRCSLSHMTNESLDFSKGVLPGELLSNNKHSQVLTLLSIILVPTHNIIWKYLHIIYYNIVFNSYDLTGLITLVTRKCLILL